MLQVCFTAAAEGVSSYSASVSVDGQQLQGFPRAIGVLQSVVNAADWHIASAALVNGTLTGAKPNPLTATLVQLTAVTF